MIAQSIMASFPRDCTTQASSLSVFRSISRYPFQGWQVQPGPVADCINARALKLPSDVCLTEAQVGLVCRFIREALR